MHDENCCPVGPGGDHQLTNGDEAEILAQATQGLAVRAEGTQNPERQ